MKRSVCVNSGSCFNRSVKKQIQVKDVNRVNLFMWKTGGTETITTLLIGVSMAGGITEFFLFSSLYCL